MSKDSIAKYHQNNKERVQKKACEKYQSIFEDKKKKKGQYGPERYKNLPENGKQKLVE